MTETPITPEWLGLNGWFRLDGRTVWEHQHINFGLYPEKDGVFAVTSIEGSVGTISTREDLEMLTKVLGYHGYAWKRDTPPVPVEPEPVEVATMVETTAIDMLFLELSQFTKARTAKELNMKTLIVRLCRRVTKFNDGDPVVKAALDYLKRAGLMSVGDILRDDGAAQ